MASEAILLVSAAEGNVSVMSRFLTEHDYQPQGACSLDEFDSVLHENSIDMALIDPDGFQAGIWKRCEKLRQQNIPFFVVSKHGQAANKKGQQYQATHIFEKPLAQDSLLSTIEQLAPEI